MVSNNCLEEVNRLRKAYRSDLDAYAIPTDKSNRKRHLNLEVHANNAPVHKRAKIRGTKRAKGVNADQCSKKTCIHLNTTAHKSLKKMRHHDDNNDCKILGVCSAMDNTDGHNGDITNAMNNGNSRFVHRCLI